MSFLPISAIIGDGTNVIYLRLSNEDPLTSNSTLYQYDNSVFTATWLYNDPELHDYSIVDNIKSNRYTVTNYPHNDDMSKSTFMPVLESGETDIPLTDVEPAAEGRNGDVLLKLFQVLKLLIVDNILIDVC